MKEQIKMFVFLQVWEAGKKREHGGRGREWKREGHGRVDGCLQIVPIIFIDELDVYVAYFG